MHALDHMRFRNLKEPAMFSITLIKVHARGC